jgi:micrococcal nuclease
LNYFRLFQGMKRQPRFPGVAFFFGLPFRVFLGALLLVAFAQGALAETWRVGVRTVLDGDTLILDGGERLRLRGIDAPEVSRQDTSGQYYSRESRNMLSLLVSGRILVLDRKELGMDRYGRLVGVARLADGRMVNLLMIEGGAAFVYPHTSDKDRDLTHRLRAAQIKAMDQGQGFWPALLRSHGAKTGYMGTKSTKRFHTLSCLQGRKVGAANRVYFSSLQEAFAAGYAPARECSPWPVETGR